MKDDLQPQGIYVAGRWRLTGDLAENRDPSRPEALVSLQSLATTCDLDEAVAAARPAGAAWAALPPQARFAVLDAAGTEILARTDEIGRLLSREEGKILPEAVGEAERAGMIFKFMAGEAMRTGGELHPSLRPGTSVEVTREPVGVVGIITPWNYPIAIPAWKIAPALAFGNAVIFKPAELVPACAVLLTEILERAGLPPGTLSLLPGPGAEIGAAIAAHPGVDAVSFTGSAATGRGVIATAAARGARVQAEMGGKNPFVVLEDADLPLAAEAIASGSYLSTGQRCTASSRIIVVEAVHDALVEALAKKVSALRCGPADDAASSYGPVVDARQLASNRAHVRGALEEGAELVTASAEDQGLFMQPVLLAGTTNAMRINREEVFGPVAAVIPAADYDEALALANDTSFGLSAGIATRSMTRAQHFRRHVRAGMVMVNGPTAGVDFHVPFGGTRGSSYGPREQGTHAREFFTQVKTAYISPVG
ncbi:aldehyde dehydrogenase family protein [Pseudoroseicyclus sp. CXY001]|uniref:aldehyde dehydrogenase family protein n=1 Tax=Pseudoroseicyclus sp. CXY001 TaxID=3242492 RepID=UPI00358DA4DA